jgi:hypothetical protein
MKAVAQVTASGLAFSFPAITLLPDRDFSVNFKVKLIIPGYNNSNKISKKIAGILKEMMELLYYE